MSREDQTTVLSKLNRDRLKYTYNTKMFWLWLEKKARPIYNTNGFNFFFFTNNFHVRASSRKTPKNFTSVGCLGGTSSIKIEELIWITFCFGINMTQFSLC